MEAVSALNVFRITQRFASPTATVAMRVPFTYTYLQAYIEHLKATQLPGVYIDEIGPTQEWRTLQAIRFEDLATGNVNERKTVVVIAREHATEHASSWCLYGMMAELIADSQASTSLRQGVTWIFIPIQDPDGSVNAVFERLTDAFRKPNDSRTPVEVFDYARYFADYVTAGHTIDVVVSLHNVEANETPNVFCPIINPQQKESITHFNTELFSRLAKERFTVGKPDSPWDIGFPSFRLYGFIAAHYGSIDLAYEVNDRYPARRLNIDELQSIGRCLTRHLYASACSGLGSQWHQRAKERVDARAKRRTEYFKRVGYSPELRTKADILTFGY